MDICKHCRCLIENGTHAEGSYRGKHRCGSESGLPYGYEAEAPGEPCSFACLGSVRLDPNEVQA